MTLTLAAALPLLVVLAQAPVPEAAGGSLPEGTVRIVDPGDESGPRHEDATSVFTSETLAWRRHRWDLERFRIHGGGGQDVGGNALLGLRVGSLGQVRQSVSDPAVRDRFGDWDGHGAAVIEVFPDSPAEDAWLQAGDVVVRFAGIWIDTPETLIRVSSRAEPNRDYEVWILRGDQVYSAWITPRDRGEVARPGTDGAAQEVMEGTIGLELPRLLEAPAARYPEDALRAGAGGAVLLLALVDREGAVADVRVQQASERQSGGLGFEKAAVEAVRARRYEPGALDGRTVSVWMTLAVEFLPEPPTP